MKKNLGIAVALLSILFAMSLASTVNAENWGVSEGETYEWDVIEATEGYENFFFYNGTSIVPMGLNVTTGDVVKFTIEKLNTSDISGFSCRGTLEIGNITVENIDQSSIAGDLYLGSWYTSFEPGLISSIDWDTVKTNADDNLWDCTESGNSITFTQDSESTYGDTTWITSAEITYDKDTGVLTEGKTNVTTDIRIEPPMSSDISLTTDSIIIVTAISLELVVDEDEGTDWMLLGGIALAVAVVAILVVLIKR